jgi:hypothetical protein
MSAAKQPRAVAHVTITPQQLTEAIARAAALDACDRNMRRHGRTVWNADDARVAQREFVRLWSKVEA